jgi:uncharacterized protein (DUF924 family)
MQFPGMTRAVSDPQSIVTYWTSAGPDRWFKPDAELDADIGRKFYATYEPASINDLVSWEGTAKGALALALVLDHFPRRMFPGKPEAYVTNPLAREIAARAMKRGFDETVDAPLRTFIYMPYMHSEELADQEQSQALFAKTGDPALAKLAELHLEMIRKFKRFPQRNEVLGRQSSPEELAALNDNQPNPVFF